MVWRISHRIKPFYIFHLSLFLIWFLIPFQTMRFELNFSAHNIFSHFCNCVLLHRIPPSSNFPLFVWMLISFLISLFLYDASLRSSWCNLKRQFMPFFFGTSLCFFCWRVSLYFSEVGQENLQIPDPLNLYLNSAFADVSFLNDLKKDPVF